MRLLLTGLLWSEKNVELKMENAEWKAHIQLCFSGLEEEVI
jgi:hypothetical protein